MHTEFWKRIPSLEGDTGLKSKPGRRILLLSQNLNINKPGKWLPVMRIVSQRVRWSLSLNILEKVVMQWWKGNDIYPSKYQRCAEIFVILPWIAWTYVVVHEQLYVQALQTVSVTILANNWGNAAERRHHGAVAFVKVVLETIASCKFKEFYSTPLPADP